VTTVLLVAVLWLAGCALVVAFMAGAARLNAAADVLAEAERIIEAAS
jgi:hypothetical protein